MSEPTIPDPPTGGPVQPTEVPSVIGDMALTVTGTPQGLVITLRDTTTDDENSGLFTQRSAVEALAKAGILSITPSQMPPITRGTDGVLYAGPQPLPTMEAGEHLALGIAHVAAWLFLRSQPEAESDVQYVISQIGKKAIRSIGDISIGNIERIVRAVVGSGAVTIVRDTPPQA